MQKSDIEFQLSKLQRQDSLREKILRGVTNQNQLAVAYGVTQKTISLDMRDIYEQIKSESLKDFETEKAFRIKQFTYLGILALNEYDKSKQDIEEKALVTKSCTNCFGQKQIEDNPGIFTECGTCKGTGKIKSEETIRIKQQTGDPAYLRIFHEVTKEISRIQGIYPRNSYKRQLEMEAESVGGKISLKVKELFLEAPADLLINAVSILDELQEGIKNGSAKVIETESKRIEEDQSE